MQYNTVLHVDPRTGRLAAKRINTAVAVPATAHPSALDLSKGPIGLTSSQWVSFTRGEYPAGHVPIKWRVLLTTSANIIDESEQPATAPPLGIWRLASWIASTMPHVDVSVCDPNIAGMEVLTALLACERFDVIGVSVIPANLDADLALLSHIKRLQPAAIIAIGGVTAGSLSAENVPVDYIVDGSGEVFFDRLLGDQCMALSRPDHTHTFVSKQRREPTMIDASMMPIGHGDLIHLTGYSSRTLFHKFSNACPETCFWCVSPKDGIVWKRSGQAVEALIAGYQNEWHDNISIVDNNLAAHGAYMRHVCGLLRESAVRSVPKHGKSTVTGMTAGLINALQGAGFVRLAYGVESFDLGVRQLLGKSYSDETLQSCLLNTVSAGIRPEINLILCSPFETIASLRHTLEQAAHWVETHDCWMAVVLGLYCTVATAQYPKELTVLMRTGDNGTDSHPWIFAPGAEVRGLFFEALRQYNDAVIELRRTVSVPIPHHVKSLIKCRTLARLVSVETSAFDRAIQRQMYQTYVHV